MVRNSAEVYNKLCKLVSDLQGAPFPVAIDNELYSIWYEHAQKNAIDCFEYLDENYPEKKEQISEYVESCLSCEVS